MGEGRDCPPPPPPVPADAGAGSNPGAARKVARSGVNAADKNVGPAGAPPARPPGAGGTFPIAPHARSRPWGSFGESAREAAFKSKCATQVLNLRRGPSRAKKMEFRLRLKKPGYINLDLSVSQVPEPRSVTTKQSTAIKKKSWVGMREGAKPPRNRRDPPPRNRREPPPRNRREPPPRNRRISRRHINVPCFGNNQLPVYQPG